MVKIEKKQKKKNIIIINKLNIYSLDLSLPCLHLVLKLNNFLLQLIHDTLFLENPGNILMEQRTLNKRYQLIDF